jgi:hypothetical protein
MPSWVKDEAKWAKAKEIAKEEYDGEPSDEAYWKLVTGIYKRMGGVIAKAVPVLFVKSVAAGPIKQSELLASSKRYRNLLERRTDGSPEAMKREDKRIGGKAKLLIEGEVRARARERYGTPPNVGDRIEFLNDRITDKGPSAGEVIAIKPTVDGYYVRVKHSDTEEWLSWEDMRDRATKKGDLWMIKAQPTEAQIEAGNYKKEHRRFRGLDISIENPKGSTRSGTDPNGHKWSITMKNDYGYIRGTLGVAPDKDHLDVYLGPDEAAENVYIVHQRKAGNWKDWDEDKCLIGFKDKESAVAAYLKHYDDPRFLGPVTTMPFDEFKEKVMNHKGKPIMVKAVPILFLKTHVEGYTKKDGTYVGPHEDSRTKKADDHPVKKPFSAEEKRDNDGKLLAPNGKPSKLNAVQWRQVRSPEFLAWFGDWINDPANASKVVDENGEPLVVYHGAVSGGGFTEFKNPDGDAIFFTKTIKHAASYAGGDAPAEDWFNAADPDEVPGLVYSVFLNIRTPLEADFGGRNWKGFALDEDGEQTDDKDESLHTHRLEEQARDEGRDGVIFRNVVDPGQEEFVSGYERRPETEFGVFDATQIKSAIGNTGAFSPDHTSILKCEIQRDQFVKTVPILLTKAHHPATTRKLASGKVVNVRAYDNSRRKQPQRDDRTMDMFGEHPEPMPEKSPAQADLGASGGDLFGGESETKQEPHEQLSAMLKRGDLNGAVNVLRAMTYEGAHEAILRAGFAVGSIKRKTAADVVAAVQGQLVQAAKRKTDGFGLRESKRPDTITEPRSEMVK